MIRGLLDPHPALLPEFYVYKYSTSFCAASNIATIVEGQPGGGSLLTSLVPASTRSSCCRLPAWM